MFSTKWIHSKPSAPPSRAIWVHGAPLGCSWHQSTGIIGRICHHATTCPRVIPEAPQQELLIKVNPVCKSSCCYLQARSIQSGCNQFQESSPPQRRLQARSSTHPFQIRPSPAPAELPSCFWQMQLLNQSHSVSSRESDSGENR